MPSKFPSMPGMPGGKPIADHRPPPPKSPPPKKK